MSDQSIPSETRLRRDSVLAAALHECCSSPRVIAAITLWQKDPERFRQVLMAHQLVSQDILAAMVVGRSVVDDELADYMLSPDIALSCVVPFEMDENAAGWFYVVIDYTGELPRFEVFADEERAKDRCFEVAPVVGANQ